MRPEKIVNIRYIGKIDSIDIEVDNQSHIFFANGLATSNSHSLQYSVHAYWSAYAKTHFPLEFFASYLAYAWTKIKPQKEIYQLVNDAKNFGIYIQPPNLRRMNTSFQLIDGKIYFGLSDIKHVGESVVEKLKKISNINLEECDWYDFLTIAADSINSRSLESLINAGALDCFNLPRTKMIFDYNIYSQLTNKEKLFLQKKKFNSITDIIETLTKAPTGKGGGCHTSKRLIEVASLLEIINNPPYALVDKPHQIAQMENTLLGVCLTATLLDETKTKYKANCSCQEFNDGFNSQNSYISLACQIDEIRFCQAERGLTTGRDMAFIKASDESGSSENIVIFSDAYDEFKDLLIEGNRVLLSGERTKDKNSLGVQNVEQIF